MEFLKDIKDNTLLVVPSTLKTKILEEFNKMNYFLNIKIMSMDEVRRKIYFDYDMDAILYLIKKYKIKIDIAKTYLENMYYLTENNTSSFKLNELELIKSTLLEQGLLKQSPLFRMFLQGKNVIFYGYDFYKKEDIKLIDEIRNITSVQVFEKKTNPSKHLKVQVFDKMDEEIEILEEPEKKTVSLKEIDERLMTIDDFLNDNK